MIASLISEVENAVANGDSTTRMAMLRRLTNLFSEQAPALAEGQVDVFDEVILKLSQNVETIARAALSRSIADTPNGPPRVLRDLAFDPAASVAGPVLSRSERISESDLVQIAQERGQDHLFAISRRRSLSERVTDVLVVRGDQSVVRSVAGNNGARFSESGFSVLTERASADEALRNILELRNDIPANHMARIVAVARQRAAENLAKDFSPAAVSQAVGAAVNAAVPQPASNATGLAATIAEFDERVRTGAIDLDEKQIAAWLNEGKSKDALIALARLASVPPEMAIRSFSAPDYEPLLFLVRSVKFGWGTFKLLIQSRPGKTLNAEDMRGAFEAFQALSVATAQRVVRFTSAREAVKKTDAA
ncbi:DUF2336 domain-containing protein [Methylobacterium sp. sgz302541]|uniref:DUF2336 domain-containing protein n=1 Tax=unclassified Methylobacterium TaxID=2615210 RepID=UPI003D34AE09